MGTTAIIGAIALLLVLAAGPEEEGALEQYAGSFELDTGQVITGGPFVERAGDPVRFLYLDTASLDTGGLFERESELVLRSIQPPGIRLELVRDAAGRISEIVWQGGGETVHGRRVAPHRARSVSIPTADETLLQGRLLLPECPGPHPLVVLVGGSGPTTRWGGVFETFFVHLGMAALTYDKRGVGSDDWYEPGLETLAADAVAALRAGRSMPEIDPGRAGFWASSQGGWVAPIAASREAPSFLVVRVGPGVTELDTYLHEIRQELRTEGLSGLDLDNAMALHRGIYEVALAGDPISRADEIAAPYVGKAWYRVAFGDGPISALWSDRWWRWVGENFAISPVPSLSRLDLPVLWFLAEDDENVPLVPSRIALDDAFAASPGEDETLVVIPDVKHSFLVEKPDGRLHYAKGFFERQRGWLAERGLSREGCFESPRGDRLGLREWVGFPGSDGVVSTRVADSFRVESALHRWTPGD